ncbi:MAG TPA: hypothetical protein VFM18_18180 [Methanosarcina sp.]|nr:hypothetical protein [Methanosarcina sp.]
MSKDFLSQSEVDSLLKGVMPDDEIFSSGFLIQDSWSFSNGTTLHEIRFTNAKVKDWLLSKDLRSSIGISAHSNNVIIDNEILTMMKLKFENQFKSSDNLDW